MATGPGAGSVTLSDRAVGVRIGFHEGCVVSAGVDAIACQQNPSLSLRTGTGIVFKCLFCFFFPGCILVLWCTTVADLAGKNVIDF